MSKALEQQRKRRNMVKLRIWPESLYLASANIVCPLYERLSGTLNSVYYPIVLPILFTETSMWRTTMDGPAYTTLRSLEPLWRTNWSAPSSLEGWTLVSFPSLERERSQQCAILTLIQRPNTDPQLTTALLYRLKVMSIWYLSKIFFLPSFKPPCSKDIITALLLLHSHL